MKNIYIFFALSYVFILCVISVLFHPQFYLDQSQSNIYGATNDVAAKSKANHHLNFFQPATLPFSVKFT